MRLSWRSFTKLSIYSSLTATKVVIYTTNTSSHRNKHEVTKQEGFNKAAFGGGVQEKEVMGNRVLETGESITCYFLTNFCFLSETKWVFKTSLSTIVQVVQSRYYTQNVYTVTVVAQSAICEINRKLKINECCNKNNHGITCILLRLNLKEQQIE